MSISVGTLHQFYSRTIFIVVSLALLSAFIANNSIAQNINDSAHFPDPNFLAAVESFMGGDFTEAQAAAKTGDFGCSNLSIGDLTGIEYFTGIGGLNCEKNQLTSLDISNNTALNFLRCGENQLTSLDVSLNTALDYLWCNNNQLTSLDVSYNTALTEFRFFGNELTSLDISNNTALTTFSCGDNQLTSLDVSNNTALAILYCYENQLTSLDVSNNTALAILYCYENQLTSLDVSNNTALSVIYCWNNQLTSLDVSHNTALIELVCFANQLTSLDISHNTALTTFSCDNNQLTSLDVSHNTALTIFSCGDNQLTSLDFSNNTALEEFYCNYNQLTSLDFSNNTALYHLQCYGNQLTSLDVSNNTALAILYCYENQLTSLDVSNNTALWHLHCYENQLTSLDVSYNTALEWLRCDNNQLTNISSLVVNTGLVSGDNVNVSYNNLSCDDWADIQTLISRIGAGFVYSPQNGFDPFYCTVNINTSAYFPDANFLDAVRNFMGLSYPEEPFTGIDAEAKTGTFDCSGLSISDMTGIEYFTGIERLDCWNNQLTSLDVSNNTALTELNCGVNQLTSLDVSSNTALVIFWCSNNELTSLDVSNNTALTRLDCGVNKLTSLDVSSNTALTSLLCGVNQLTSLDVSNNSALNLLWCGGNELTSLDVSNSAGLTELRCDDNELTSLDVSNNTALTILYCGANQLTSLDVSNNTALTGLYCGWCQLTDISSLVTNLGFGAGDDVDVRWNNLSCDDWAAILVLQNRGVILDYSPQNGMNPFYCASIDTSYLVNGNGFGGRYWPGRINGSYFDARFIPATALGGEETYPAWCADMLTKIQLGAWYNNVGIYTSETDVCSLVGNPENFKFVNYLLVNYRYGLYVGVDQNVIQAVVWKLLFNGKAPKIGGNGISSGGFISWDDSLATSIYNTVRTTPSSDFPDYENNSFLPIAIIIDTGDQVNLLEIPYWMYLEFMDLGIVGDCS